MKALIRSWRQMAKALLREAAGDRFEVVSPGFEPQGVGPIATRPLSEITVNISGRRSTTLGESQGRTDLDSVITACEHAAGNCPAFSGSATRLHRSALDRAAVQATEGERLKAFRNVRDGLATHCSSTLANLSQDLKADSEAIT